MQNNMSGAGIVIAAILGFIAVFLTLGRVDTYLKIRAMDDCAKTSRVETQADDGARVIYPVVDVYQSCLTDKGYSVTQ